MTSASSRLIFVSSSSMLVSRRGVLPISPNWFVCATVTQFARVEGDNDNVALIPCSTQCAVPGCVGFELATIKAMLPKLDTFMVWAIIRTCTISTSMSFRKRLQKVFSVSWSGCSSAATKRNATESLVCSPVSGWRTHQWRSRNSEWTAVVWGGTGPYRWCRRCVPSPLSSVIK